MTTIGWLQVTLAALLLGTGLGAWGAMRFAKRRAAAAIARKIEGLEQQHAAALGQLRAAQTRAQAELEQTRNNFKRQLMAAASEPSAQLARVEEHLRIAYAELDRLRAKLNGPDTAAHPELTDGFAATQPMPTSKF